MGRFGLLAVGRWLSVVGTGRKFVSDGGAWLEGTGHGSFLVSPSLMAHGHGIADDRLIDDQGMAVGGRFDQ